MLRETWSLRISLEIRNQDVGGNTALVITSAQTGETDSLGSCRRLTRSSGRSKTALQGGQVFGDRPPSRPFHRSIPTNHVRAERSQRCGAAASASQCGLDDRLPEQKVHALDQKPRGTVRHLHVARGFTDRSAVANRFQNLDFSRTQGTIAAQIQSKQHACHGFIVRQASPDDGDCFSLMTPPGTPKVAKHLGCSRRPR